MLKCPTCNSKKSRFMKEKEGNGLLSHVGIKTPLSKIPLFSDKFTKINSIINSSYSQEINSFLRIIQDNLVLRIVLANHLQKTKQ